MRKQYLIITAGVLLLIAACSSSSAELREKGSSSTELSETKAGEEHGTIMLTKAEFLTRVFNYEKNPNEWVYEGDRPALIDFYADWCAPCRITSPILEELAKEYGDRIDIYKINTDKEQELAMVFGIQGIPSFLFIPMEGKPTMSSGIAQTPEETKEMFRKQIDELLLKQ
jgi:thioredoxin